MSCAPSPLMSSITGSPSRPVVSYSNSTPLDRVRGTDITVTSGRIVGGMHPGQLSVPIATVRALVREQFPAWADLPVRAVESHGTVNALFRIGDGLTARFPLTPGDIAAIRRWLESEAGAARQLLGRTRFATPEPVAVGEP